MHTTTIEHQIRRMNVQEIQSFISDLKKDPTQYLHYNQLIAICRNQYRQLTGTPLSILTINRL